MIFLIIPIIWIALTVLIVGLCFAARLGDQAQREPPSASYSSTYPSPCTSQSASQPDPSHEAGPYTVRRPSRVAMLPGWLRSRHNLSAR